MKVHAFVFDLAIGGKSICTGLKEKSSIVEVLVFSDFLAMMNFRCYVSFVFVFVLVFFCLLVSPLYTPCVLGLFLFLCFLIKFIYVQKKNPLQSYSWHVICKNHKMYLLYMLLCQVGTTEPLGINVHLNELVFVSLSCFKNKFGKINCTLKSWAICRLAKQPNKYD